MVLRTWRIYDVFFIYLFFCERLNHKCLQDILQNNVFKNGLCKPGKCWRTIQLYYCLLKSGRHWNWCAPPFIWIKFEHFMFVCAKTLPTVSHYLVEVNDIGQSWIELRSGNNHTVLRYCENILQPISFRQVWLRPKSNTAYYVASQLSFVL